MSDTISDAKAVDSYLRVLQEMEFEGTTTQELANRIERRWGFKPSPNYVDAALRKLSADGRVRETLVQTVGSHPHSLWSQNLVIEKRQEDENLKANKAAILRTQFESGSGMRTIASMLRSAGYPLPQVDIEAALKSLAEDDKVQGLSKQDGEKLWSRINYKRLTRNAIFDHIPDHNISQNALVESLKVGWIHGPSR
jgi:hypothetical protein